MPELPEVETVRRTLEPVLVGARIEDVELRRPNLRTAFPVRFRERLTGRTVTALRRRAKYLLAELSSGDTLVMHLGMTGSFEVEPSPEQEGGRPSTIRVPDRHDHVVFRLDSGTTVTFNDPRRFGSMDLLDAAGFAAHPIRTALGPEPLSPEFGAEALGRACAGRKTAIKVALLDQHVVAGLGNIYACEALHVARLSPFRTASTLATTTGRPRQTAKALAAAIKQVLAQAVRRRATAYRASRFRVYGRTGEPCPRRGCSGTIRQRVQAGRSTFFCPVCQRERRPPAHARLSQNPRTASLRRSGR